MKLKISNTLGLPIDACTQTFSILAKRRAGKTYTALVMAEEFVSASIPFVFLDPLGAAWGLRSSSDGKTEGLPVVIIGGAHGDVPLEATAGKVIADLVVDHPGFYIVDMSLTQSNAEQDRFACDFAERLYRRKEQKREPLHVFVDEADSFAPQRPMPGQQRMLGAFEALVRRGGIRGIGTTLITQRPAVLNKNVLTQTECLIALQMTAPQDKAAVDAWVKDNGTDEQRDTLMKSLATLPRGRAWIWSPSWLEVFNVFDVRKRHTFDSSATPKAGVKVTAKKMAPVDLDWLGKEIAATVTRAKENDPGHLKKEISILRTELIKKDQQIAQLQKGLATHQSISPANSGLLASARSHIDAARSAVGNAAKQAHESLSRAMDIVHKVEDAPPKTFKIIPPTPGMIKSLQEALTLPPTIITKTEEVTLSDGKLGKCERAILQVLAQYPHGRYPNQVALITGYSAKSGSFANALCYLRSHGMITRNQPMTITPHGANQIGPVEPLPTGEALQQIWFGKLGKCEREILQCLLKHYPEGLPAAIVAEQIGYSQHSGSFANALCRLRTLELITRGQPMKASENFFQ